MKISIIAVTIFLLTFIEVAAWSQSEDKNLLAEIDVSKTNSPLERQESLLQYIRSLSAENYNSQRVRVALDTLGFVILHELNNPTKIEEVFSPLTGNDLFDDAAILSINEWIAAAQDWRQYGGRTPQTRSALLFKLGKKHYESAHNENRSEIDQGKHLDLAIQFLSLYVVHFENPKLSPEALYMLARARKISTSPFGSGTHAATFYLKEIIRRFPHSTFAAKAFPLLEEEIHFQYTGSSGDNTPEGVDLMLRDYKNKIQMAVSRS